MGRNSTARCPGGQGERARDTFTFLADEEVRHKKTFEKMLAKMERCDIDEVIPGSTWHTCRTIWITKSSSPRCERDGISRGHGHPSAIDFAIQREMNAVLYYHEVKKFIALSQQDDIDKIIEEERRHFSQLTEMKKNYGRRKRSRPTLERALAA